MHTFSSRNYYFRIKYFVTQKKSVREHVVPKQVI